ncbi:MAG: CZB domain-containing protein [Myxococcaceae bacterium]
MDLKQAVEKHAAWKMKFRSAISAKERMDQVTIGKDNVCELGAWLYGPGRSECGHCQSFQLLIESHRQFHLEAGKVAAAISAGRYDEAQRLLDGPAYAAASQKAVMQMMSVQREKQAKAA